MLEQWLRFPTHKMPLRRNYEAGSWHLNSPSALNKMGKELRQCSSRQCSSRQCVRALAVLRARTTQPRVGQHNWPVPVNIDLLSSWKIMINISSTSHTVFAQFDMCCCESFACAVCMGTVNRTNLFWNTACLKDKEVVLGRVWHCAQ